MWFQIGGFQVLADTLVETGSKLEEEFWSSNRVWWMMRGLGSRVVWEGYFPGNMNRGRREGAENDQLLKE